MPSLSDLGIRLPVKRKPRSVLVIAPSEVVDDELRLMRLDAYLHTAFPALAFVLAEENTLPGRQSAVGVLPDLDGSHPFGPEETDRITAEVSDAVAAFAEYRVLLH